MSKFNKKKINNITTYEGGSAYKLTPKEELFNLVATSFLSDSFYESEDDRLLRLKKLISRCDHEYVAKLAVYARTKLNMRTLPLVLLVELAKIHNGDSLIQNAVYRTISRADELAEILACYQKLSDVESHKHKLSKISVQLKKGIARAFHKFDLYNFQKYNRNNKIKLRDVLFLTHPKPKDEKEKELFNKIANNTLGPAHTWEYLLSEEGKKEFPNMKKCWEDLIDEPLNSSIVNHTSSMSKVINTLFENNLNVSIDFISDKESLIKYGHKLPIMAVLRNLKNMLNVDVSIDHVNKIYNMLTDKKTILNSKQLPFRFLSAYLKVIESYNNNEKYQRILDGLEEAVKLSADNLPFNKTERIHIVSDVSGSMFSKISKNSSVTLYDIGLLLSMIYKFKCKLSTSGLFGSRYEKIVLPGNNILSNILKLRGIEGKLGYETNGHLIIESMIENREVYDRILIFSDGQFAKERTETFNQLIRKYRNIMNNNAKFYIFDLSGYSSVPVNINDNNTFYISGFSDNIFKLFDIMDNRTTIIEEVEKTEL